MKRIGSFSSCAHRATELKGRTSCPLTRAKNDEKLKEAGLEDEDITEDEKIPLLFTFPEDDAADSIEEQPQGIVPEERMDLPLVNGFSAYLTPDRMDKILDMMPDGVELAINKKIRYPDAPKILAMSTSDTHGNPKVARLPGIEKVWEQGFTGKGQTIAVIDSGIHPHPDLKDKVVAWVDFSREKKKKMTDPYGHGTHVAGVAAGTGASSDGEVKGVAPDAELVGLRITTVAEAIRALQWVIEHKDEHNIGVVNMSLGDTATKGFKNDPWAQAVEKAMEAGLVVVVAAGNEGPDASTVSTPGIHPDAITVGAYDNKGTPEVEDDTIASFSSRGPTPDGLGKPDILAPGVGVFSTLSPKSNLDVPDFPHMGNKYMAMSGTSQATPMISGLAALMLEANPNLTQDQILSILRQSAVKNFDGEANVQGAGLVQADKAIELALAARDGGGALAA